MGDHTLRAVAYTSAQVRKMDRNTLIEDTPQVSIRRAAPTMPKSRRIAISPLSESFPTPKGNCNLPPIQENSPVSPASSDAPSDYNSMWSKRSSESEFDEMYDLTGSESEGDVPIKLSRSVKKRVEGTKPKYPSLVIPSPSEWPTHDKVKSAVTPLSPPIKISLAPSVLSQLQAARVPSSSAAPSLDGSATDEEFALSSCPSTPDLSQRDDDEQPWELPIQLDPSSISLLAQINGDDQLETVIEVPEETMEEMREVVDSPPITARMRLQTQNLNQTASNDLDEELSALSVPSPGGFFASLDSSIARHTWAGAEVGPTTSTATQFYDLPFRQNRQTALPTSTATRFYGLPWDQAPVEQTITFDSPVEEQDPVTAKKIIFSPTEDVKEINEVDETYDSALQQSAAANIDRTALWLNAQSDYMKALCEDEADPEVLDSFRDIDGAVPKTPDQTSPSISGTSPSKKSVRFTDETTDATKLQTPNIVQKRISPIHDGTFWEGWRHNKRSQRARDVFQHRQARAEAEHVKRTSCQKQHLEQLQGKYDITETDRPAPSRPISNLMPSTVEDEKKEVIERAERERKALEQMQSSSWQLSAQKELAGGKLLTSPIVQSFKDRTDVRILDLAGQVHCSWAWNVAIEHPKAAVYTTVSTDAEAHVAESTLEGPANHFVVASPKAWELPFEDNYFDIISSRNLYTHLKTIWPKGHGADEWDLTLRECMRCLKPGGYLEFNLLDAELVHPESACQALGVEFAFNLKTRGYDPNAGKTFLPRLKRAGFQSIKRAWMVLPVADVVPRWTDSGKVAGSNKNGVMEKVIDANGEVQHYEAPVTGSTQDVRAVTGIVGARMWEQWMLKLNGEMGRDDDRCLEGVANALEESGKSNAGWRCLVGWAKKEM